MRHETTVAVIRGSNGRHLLRTEAEKPLAARPLYVRSRNRSIIEDVRKWARLIETGEARNQSDLARQIGLSQPRVSQLLGLLKLPAGIQNYLVHSNDLDGSLSDLHVRELLRLPTVKAQLAAFRRLIARCGQR